jgi:periplasmic copper chaperone A
MRTLLASALLALSATAAMAGPVDITDAWFRALPGGLPAGGYFTATNTTQGDIAITGARTDACGMIMMHLSKGGGMEMVDKVTVPAGGVIKFQPGGYHLMCMNPTPQMKPGGKAPVVLSLSNGTGVAVAFAVRDAKGK